MPDVYSALACNLDTNILQASLPLFESEKVQAIEWSFDTLHERESIPDWFTELLNAYSQENRLIGHGVFFSLFAGRWTAQQQEWLSRLKSLSDEYTFHHITEHFGFTTGEDFHKGAPLSIPFTASTLALGQDRLKRIQNACYCPVGLENLAFAYSLDDVKRHGDFLHRLLEPVNGFIILDLHNLFCQIQNFSIDAADLLALYPLDNVREIHISGGSWTFSSLNPERKIRRDTHDDAVPAEVFTLLEQVLDRCPDVAFVVLEQLGSGLATDKNRQVFQQDFFKMDELLSRHNCRVEPSWPTSFLPDLPHILPAPPLEDWFLQAQQTELSTILETSVDYHQAHTLLGLSSLANSAWEIETWDAAMLETALAIARKWKQGFPKDQSKQPDMG